MGHLGQLTTRTYLSLQRRMDRAVPGLTDSEYLYEILKILFAEEEAKYCSVMPFNMFSKQDMAKTWGTPLKETEKILNTLADKGLVYHFEIDNAEMYGLAAPVLGFFEFSLMRIDGRFDRKKLSELYNQYITEEGRFVKKFFSVMTPISRAFVYEDEVTSEILPYEKAREVIDTASCITVGTCFCRHKMAHLGKSCGQPEDVCLTFNEVAKYISKHKIAREISKAEAHKILDLCIENGLVQIGDNVKKNLQIICNCCGCCCDLLLGYKRFSPRHVVNPTNYIAEIDPEKCKACGICVKKCPVDAITSQNGKYSVNKSNCLGCGVCSRFCPEQACRLTTRPKRTYVPDNVIEASYLRAIEQAKIGSLIFDDPTSVSYKIFRPLIDLFIKIPPVKALLLKKIIYKTVLNIFLNSRKFSTFKKFMHNEA
jgi:ferredoxin